jgi:Glycoside hydrolase family 44
MVSMRSRIRSLVFRLCLLVTLLTVTRTEAQSNQTVYADSLENGWQNWSWAIVNFSATNVVHSGSYSISVLCTNYEAVYFHQDGFDVTPYTNLTFWINGGPVGGQSLQVQAVDNANSTVYTNSFNLPSLAPNTWQQINVPISALQIANPPGMDGFWIQSPSASLIPVFYVDDVSFQAGPPPTPVTNATATIMVNAASDRLAISPLIYGVAFGVSNQLSDLNCPINRSGGNAETRYNWQLDAHNRAADWYFESIADSSGTPGLYDDTFITSTHLGGAQPMLTIPMIGWSPKLGPGRADLSSYSIAKYGPQTGDDSQYFADAGNGISVTNDTHITWNDPNDANFATNSAYQMAWVQHLTNVWGVSTNSGVRYYLMDNEHSIWQSTHQDIHPVGPTMQEIRGKILDYAGMVKSMDPNALVLWPEEWGWSGYFYSGYDQQWAGAHNDYNPADYPDRSTNGGWDYIPWLLNQLYQHDTNSGQRLIDYLTVHYYPQATDVSGSDVSTATQLLRNRSTRSLWDTNYVDESWINSVVMLIPRLQNWAATYYPGTKVGITEYNWGAEAAIGGATAEADVLGIFGRQGLNLGTRWTMPVTGTPTYNAFKMYRNYDGKLSTFGDTSVFAGGPDPDNVAVFAAQRTSDAALTIMVVSKYLNGPVPLSISLSNYIGSGTAQVWQLNSTNVITRLSNLSYSSGSLNLLVPGQSVTLFVIEPTVARLVAGTPRSDGQFEFWLDAEIGQTYILQGSTNLSSWSAVSTNTLTNSQLHFLLPQTSTRRFYRAHLL